MLQVFQLQTFYMKLLLFKKKTFGINPDILGMCSSMICLVHCLFLPLLLILQPILFSFVEDLQAYAWWEWLDFVFLAIGLLAVILATQKVSSTRKKLFYVAYLVFSCGIFLGGNWIILSYIGSFALTILHLKNYQKHKNCKI